MTLEGAVLAGAQWLWNEYGREIADKTLGELHARWQRFHWGEAESKYRARMRDQYSTTRLLGHPKPINIENIFTDVYFLDTPTAFKRYDLVELQRKPFSRDAFRLDQKRRSALRYVEHDERLYILGKPGAGKTTFLKYLVLQACLGRVTKSVRRKVVVQDTVKVLSKTVQMTPIFVSLKEWADSGQGLMPFMVRQFEICNFPDAQAFIEKLLENGTALVLFDGLDEVNQENEMRYQVIRAITDFVNQYPEIKVCVTCRIAANEYSFSRFTYLEIADFDEPQIKAFTAKWYQDDGGRLKRFLSEFEKPEHEGLKELARTPLLLALLCLSFDETLSFPARRVDLYKDALDALLRKWDTSRLIKRDEVYRQLSPRRKEQLLARIAADSFSAGNYFIRKDALSNQIVKYLQELPDSDNYDSPDGESVLRAIEAQHGILVERAQGIYSFSHLTFQEYLTAKYIVENAGQGTVGRLLQRYISDSRWHEVFLSVASLFDNADFFFMEFKNVIYRPTSKDESVVEVLRWAQTKAIACKRPNSLGRAVYLFAAFYNSLCIKFDEHVLRTLQNIIQIINEIDPVTARVAKFSVEVLVKIQDEIASKDPAYKTAIMERATARMFDIVDSIGGQLNIDDQSISINTDSMFLNRFNRYLRANQLFLECLKLSLVSNRPAVIDWVLAI